MDYSNITYKRLYILSWLSSIDAYCAQKCHKSASQYIHFSKDVAHVLTAVSSRDTLAHDLLYGYSNLINNYTKWLRIHNITFKQVDNADRVAYKKLIPHIINLYLGYCLNHKTYTACYN